MPNFGYPPPGRIECPDCAVRWTGHDKTCWVCGEATGVDVPYIYTA